MSARRTTNVHILMTPDEAAQLKKLAHAMACSAAHCVRTLVRAAVKMQLQHQPTCASGQACYVPQLHTQTATPDAPEENEPQ